MRRRFRVVLLVTAASAPGAAVLPGLASSTAATPSAPTTTTGGVTHVHVDSAKLHGTVNPNGQPTTYHFAYGHKPGFHSSTPAQSAGTGTAPLDVSAVAKGLLSGTGYHYRLVASNAVGTTTGSRKTFTTLDPRLRGRFDMNVVVRRGGHPFRQRPGEAFHRRYRFKPHCPAARCPSVHLRRRGQHGRFSSGLARQRSGVYAGVERFRGGWCDDGLRFKSKTRIRIRVVRLQGDQAKRVRGTLRPRVRGCVRGSERARLKGLRP